MANEELEGGPAFPGLNIAWHGMSLRDYFAGQFAAAIFGQYNPNRCAEIAYEYADAMLKVKYNK